MRAARPGPGEKGRRQRRACLRCDREFWSEGAHNRLCPACHESLKYQASEEPLYALNTAAARGQVRARRR
jgi:hypothetical protein